MGNKSFYRFHFDKKWTFGKVSENVIFISLICAFVVQVASRHAPKFHHFGKKYIAEPSMIFGYQNRNTNLDLLLAPETEAVEHLIDAEFAKDSKFRTELINKNRFTRSAKAGTEDEDDSDEDEMDGNESKSTEDEATNDDEYDEKKTTITSTVRSTSWPTTGSAAPEIVVNGSSTILLPQGRALPNDTNSSNSSAGVNIPRNLIGRSRGSVNTTQIMSLPPINGTLKRTVLVRNGIGAKPIPPGVRTPGMLANDGATKPLPKKGELYIPEDYNNLEIPRLDFRDFEKLFGIKSKKIVPLPVLVFLNIRSLRDIDETTGEVVLDMDMKVQWIDIKIFNPSKSLKEGIKVKTLDPVFLKKIWKPDIFIEEMVKVRKSSLMAQTKTLRLFFGSGLISYTMRVTVRLSCEMDFNYYPSDTQRCEFHLRSYTYFDTQLNLQWLRKGVFLLDPSDPNFDLQVSSTEEVKINQTFFEEEDDTYDGLKFTIMARRKLSFHMVQTYLPSVFLIVITWLCFLIPARMVEARIGISMTTLLTLTAMFSSVRESSPIVSYVKAIDIWMVFCIFSVFLTLLEFSLLVWIRSFREDAEEKKLKEERQRQERREKSMKGGHNGRERTPSPSPSVWSEELNRYELIAEFTEKWAFFIFSVIFFVFNIIYWSWLLVESEYLNWTVNATHNGLLAD